MLKQVHVLYRTFFFAIEITIGLRNRANKSEILCCFYLALVHSLFQIYYEMVKLLSEIQKPKKLPHTSTQVANIEKKKVLVFLQCILIIFIV